MAVSDVDASNFPFVRGRLCVTDKQGNPILTCLLYTSDAADERSSVDLGGRRIIKKKKKEKEDGEQE